MSNFWKEFAFPSPIDDILKKPDFTLEELLDEDDVVVDVRSQKEALKEYLMKKETLAALIKYVVEEAPEEASEAVRFRYPVVACEILTAEVDEIERELVSDLGLLSSLFEFFAKEKVNPLMANLVLRTLLSLMTTQLVHMLDFIKSQPKSLENLISHIDCAAVPDLIMRLINSDADYEGQGTLQWLVDNDFAKMLISRFSPEYESLQSDLARTVIEILATSSESSILLKKLSAPETVDLLVEQIFKEGNFYGFRSGLAVLSQLLRTLAGHSHSDPSGDSTENSEGYSLLIKRVTSILPRLNELLIKPNKVTKLANQNREEFESFGFFRLVILQYFESLLMLGNDNLLKDLITNHVDVYKNIFGLLLQFPTNNFCHLFVERIISSSIGLASNDDIVEFVKQCEFAHVLLEKCITLKDSKFMGLPFLYKIIGSLQDRQRRTEQLDQFLSYTLQGWEELTSALEEELRSLDTHRGRDLSVSSHEVSRSDESVESSNDADDYDTQQAEVLLSKGDLDALF